jgi:predicted nucleic acid-binding protein
MSRLAVDTDVVSFLFKNHSIAQLYDSDLRGHVLVISFMTVAELDRWAIQSSWGESRRTWLSRYLEPFVVLPFDPLSARNGQKSPSPLRREAIASNAPTPGLQQPPSSMIYRS